MRDGLAESPDPRRERADVAGEVTSHPVGARRAGAAIGLLLLAAALVVGSDAFGLREELFGSATPKPTASAFSRIATATPANAQRTSLRSQPWWQGITSASGTGATTTQPFAIVASANQWRVKYSCRSGRLTVRASVQSAAVVDTGCPAAKTANVVKADKSVRATLGVMATGPWEIQVQQQVDVPLVEPPLPAMTARGASVVARGRFYRIDQSGMGRLTFYRLGDGRNALRLAGFYVNPNIDLEVRLSPLRAPHSTPQYLKARSVHVAPLDVTAGSLNFIVPRGVDPTRYGSVVIWCPLITSAYAAATLK
ncbi:MAG: DM13 domain-containing protein [Actinomycetota bacterium]|nr:DM13 domain-containing protein [Actinomycetota bacterium]